MFIRSATALRNDYDGMVKLSKENNAPIFLTRNGDGEMVFVPIEMWEQREAELDLLHMLLKREQNRLAGAKSFSMVELSKITEDMLREN